MKLISLIPKLTKHVIQIRNEDRFDTICWENTCSYHIQNIRSEKLTDLLHSQLITRTM